jgi:hypothetical protein
MLREVFVQGTADDIRWQSLSRSLEQVSTMTNGAEQAIPGLEVFGCNLGVMGAAHSLIFGLVIVFSVHLRNTSSVSCSHMTEQCHAFASRELSMFQFYSNEQEEQ